MAKKKPDQINVPFVRPDAITKMRDSSYVSPEVMAQLRRQRDDVSVPSVTPESVTMLHTDEDEDTISRGYTPVK